jgi:N,N'-diacetyllegionaminate synthase
MSCSSSSWFRTIWVPVIFDKRQFGPDIAASITIDQTTQLVTGIRQIQAALKSPINKSNIEPFQQLKSIFEKSLAVNKSLKKGEIITVDYLESKKPKGYRISANQFKEVLDKKLTTDLTK